MVRDKKTGVNKICSLFEISKKTYYECREPKERFSSKYLWIKKTVEKIIKKNPKYGVLRIKAALKNQYRITIGRDTLAKLLILWGLELRRTVRKSKVSLIRRILVKLSWKANLLIREKIDRPFQAITSDMTEITFKGGKAYLCVHKDVFGQMVYGFEVGLKQDLKLVMSSFDQAFRKIKGRVSKSTIYHQDQGTQYTSYRYIQTILNIGRISFSQKGTPTENPGQESFFGRFKEENRTEFQECKTFEELKLKIGEKIKYYNNERVHTSIGYQSPKSFTESHLKSWSNWFTKRRG